VFCKVFRLVFWTKIDLIILCEVSPLILMYYVLNINLWFWESDSEPSSMT
jgi:hypothetical protein